MLARRKIYLLLSLFLLLIPAGCSSLAPQPRIYASDKITRDDLLSGQALFGDRAREITLPEDNVMMLDDRMRAYLERYVPRNYVEMTRVRTLMDMMFGAGTLAMKYNATKTYTARDAFRKSEGNCLGFSYLFYAFARERGLDVRFQEVEIPPRWNSAGEELYYSSRHVNVRVFMRESRDYVVDIDRLTYKPYYRAWNISAKYAVALYYSNKGTDYLSEEDYENAFRYLVKALTLSPKDAAIWSNLGVLYRMKGIYNYAEQAYFIALDSQGPKKSVLSNLSALYEHMGNSEKSEYYFNLVKAYQMKNPYYRYFQALEAFEAGDYPLSLSHLKAALKKQDNEQKFYWLLGETYARLGDETRANRAMAKARQVQ